jgi:hypothetical protein
MTAALDPQPQAPKIETDDPVVAIQKVLEASSEPLTPSKIRAALPAKHKSANLEEILPRQVAAGVLTQFPKYRSQQDRYWDRPMPVHVAALLRETLETPYNLAELRRKLPVYAQPLFENILQEELAKGLLHRHPKTGRGGERYGARPADPKDYLKTELIEVFRRLEGLGFKLDQLRPAALELLHEEEWSTLPPVTEKPKAAKPEAAEEPSTEAP